jgi:hypothetical protein
MASISQRPKVEDTAPSYSNSFRPTHEPKQVTSRDEQSWDPWAPITDYERFQHYKTNRTQLTDFAQKNADSLEKTLITLCGGAFGVSLTLVGQLKDCPVNHSWCLTAAWMLFGIGLCLMVESFRITHRAYERDIELADKRYFELSEEVNEIRNTPYKFASTATWAFYLGMILLCAFAVMNTNNLMKRSIQTPINPNLSRSSTPQQAAITGPQKRTTTVGK